MKAAIYMRVSSEEQVDNFSLSAQLTALQEYCIKNNIQIFESYCDEGISGTKEDRPAFQKMILDAEKKLFEVILVHKFDRFARKVEISQRIKSRLKKASVNVISITEPIEDSPIGFFQEGLLELLSEYFIKNLSSEIKKGQKQRSIEGKHHGSVPYGYRTKDGLAYIIEAEAEVIRQIYKMYLDGLGYSRIAMNLNYSEIPTKWGNNWQHHQVDRILKNKVYCGYTFLNGEYYKSDSMPIIIPEETFEEVQRDRGVKAERYTYRGNNMNSFLLLGILRCGECGCASRIAATSKKDEGAYKYTSYVCNMASRYNMNFRCNFSKHFLARKFDLKIIQYLDDVANGKIVDVKTKRHTKVVDIVDNFSIKITKELQRAKEAYLQGVFDLNEYSQLRTKLEKELKDLSTSSPTPTVSVKDDVKKAMKKFHKIKEEDIVSRKKVLRTIIEYITVGRNGIDVYFL